MDLKWRKATRSASNGGNCIELAALPNAIAVRDSKDPDGPVLAFERSAFRAFGAALKRS